MRVLIIHNSYLERGGEDEVVEAEKSLLEKFGHEVIEYKRSNSEIKSFNVFQKIKFFLHDAFWSKKTLDEVKEIIRQKKPDIVHVHNTFLLISTSVYDACYESKIPVVQTLHNYRFLCPNGIFFRNNNLCEECLLDKRISSVKHKCWRDSFVSTWVLMRIIEEFYKRGILGEKISCFIAPSNFSKGKFIEGGLPQDKIEVKPHFADMPSVIKKSNDDKYAVFVGRLADYKGVYVLIDAFKICNDFKLKIIGDGPLYHDIKKRLDKMPNISLARGLPYKQALQEISAAEIVVVPSVCYETFGRVVIDAFSCGVPAIVSDAGAAKELVKDGLTGFIFRAGDSNHLAERISFIMKDRNAAARMGEAARKEFEEKYTAKKNYELLINIYEKTIKNYSKLN